MVEFGSGCTFDITVEVDGKESTVTFCRCVTEDYGHMEIEQIKRSNDPWRQLLDTANAHAPATPEFLNKINI